MVSRLVDGGAGLPQRRGRSEHRECAYAGWKRYDRGRNPDSSNGLREAFLFNSEGMQGLGNLSNGPFNSQALAVSADGAVVVGAGTSDGAPQAFIWTASTGMRETCGRPSSPTMG